MCLTVQVSSALRKGSQDTQIAKKTLNTLSAHVLFSPAGPTKMFLLFQAHEGALDGPPQGFAAKRAFSINLRKGFQVGLRVFVRRP
jgi:hypothetical protein